ncbi:protein penguin [Bombus vosnesenskii]|uniref:Protein penguin n=1 Tax=Bombus vosnesenskii TaxID=207650 RepID=A0A6J3K2V9_9HYME|nr:protein penguin [Bombus vosnesenskii]XP_033347432.1 protein penguin [Bombus vosnesenskii]
MTKRKLKSDNESRPKKNKTENSNHIYNNIKNNKDNKLKIEKTAKEKGEEVVTRDGKENHNINNINGKSKMVNSNSMEKPNWQEFKKKKKEIREKYKAKRFSNIYDISIVTKQLGEKLRRVDCSKLERKKLILKAHDLLKTNYNKIIFTHDMSRIIQWIFKYSDAEIRQAISKELKPSFLSMIESKYARNCIKTMLKYGSQETRHEIISTCYGNIVRFMSHSVSAPLLELMYSTWATEIEKRYFKQEFYGDMYKQAKDKKIKTLSDTYVTAEYMKTATLSAVKGNLMRILNKKFLNSTLLHCVLLEFLNNCSLEDKKEIIAMLRSSIVELSQTKFGSQVAVICIWHGSNKDRKIIMKSIKGNIKNISMSEYGYLILLALFDSVDDTVLIKKVIFSEIQNDLTDIALSDHGKHVILYLVARRNSHYFAPSIVKYLEQGDNNATSKKPAHIREKELLDLISDSLLESVIINTPIWMSNSSIAMVTLAILKVGTKEKLEKAFEAVTIFITDLKSKIKEGDEEYKPVEHAGLHMMLKKLILNDKELQEKGESSFGKILVNHLETNIIEEWIECNRGCFLLVLLLENGTVSTVNTILSKLKPVMNILKSKSNPGAKILLKKLK